MTEEETKITDPAVTADAQAHVQYLGEKPPERKPALRARRRAWIDADGDIWQARKGETAVESIQEGSIRILGIQTCDVTYGPLVEIDSEHLSTAMATREDHLRQEFINILGSAADAHAHPSVQEAFRQLGHDIAEHWNP